MDIQLNTMEVKKIQMNGNRYCVCVLAIYVFFIGYVIQIIHIGHTELFACLIRIVCDNKQNEYHCK